VCSVREKNFERFVARNGLLAKSRPKIKQQKIVNVQLELLYNFMAYYSSYCTCLTSGFAVYGSSAWFWYFASF
jgi:hypothetical protein